MSTINAQSSVAIYQQLKDIFINNIREGKWPASSKILSEREICEKYNISRITVRKAIDELVQSGYVERVQGKGTFVSEKGLEQKLTHLYSFRDELRRKGIETVVEMKRFSVIHADDYISRKLEMEKGKEVFAIERLFISDDRPYASEISYIPKSLCRNLCREEVMKNGLYRSLNNYELFPDRAFEKLRAANMTKELAGEMDGKEGDAYVEINRTTYFKDVIIEYNISCVRGDMFVYSVELK